jgi:FkbM family methyltransferase
MFKKFTKNLAAQTGYKICKQMPFFLEHDESLIQIDFEYVLSKLITSVDHCQFIQVGANDGKLNDPLRKFILKKFLKGVMIEPQPEIFKKLKGNYAELDIDGISFENIAIDKNQRYRNLYTVQTPSNPQDIWAHAAASFDKSHIEKMLSPDSLEKNGECIEPLSVRCETFDYI